MTGFDSAGASSAGAKAGTLQDDLAPVPVGIEGEAHPRDHRLSDGPCGGARRPEGRSKVQIERRWRTSAAQLMGWVLLSDWH